MIEPTAQPKPPIQKGFEMKPGYVANPFLSLIGCEPNGEMPLHLYDFAYSIDGSGTKDDFSQNLDFWAFEIRKKIMGWYESAQIAWKVKQYRAWEPHFPSFARWCEVALGKSVATVNSWIRAAGAISDLIAAGFAQLPQLYSVALELSKLPSGEMQDTWRDISGKLSEHQINLEKLKAMIDDPLNKKPKWSNVRVEEYYKTRLKEEAAAGGLSPSSLLNQILKQHFGEMQEEAIASSKDESAPVDYFPETEPEIEIIDDLTEDDGDDLPFPRTRIRREDCDDIEEALPEARGEFDDELPDDAELDDPGVGLDVNPETGEVKPTDDDPLSLAKFAKVFGRIKDYYFSNVFQDWAIVEPSGRVLPLSEWLEVF